MPPCGFLHVGGWTERVAGWESPLFSSSNSVGFRKACVFGVLFGSVIESRGELLSD